MRDFLAKHCSVWRATHPPGNRTALGGQGQPRNALDAHLMMCGHAASGAAWNVLSSCFCFVFLLSYRSFGFPLDFWSVPKGETVPWPSEKC